MSKRYLVEYAETRDDNYDQVAKDIEKDLNRHAAEGWTFKSATVSNFSGSNASIIYLILEKEE